VKIYSKNKKAFHDYHILEKLEVGLVLTGAEVKAIRDSRVQLKGSYVVSKDNHIKLVGCHISKPKHLNSFKHFDETKDRILLLSKKEKQKLTSSIQEKGLSLVILDIYQPDNTKKIKATLALVKGKKDYDKRKVLKEKQLDRDSKREMKNFQ